MCGWLVNSLKSKVFNVLLMKAAWQGCFVFRYFL
jgi:hypothetical protein